MLFPFVWFMLAMYETKEKRRCGVARWAQLWALAGAPDDFLVAAQVTQLCLAAAQKVTQPIYSAVSCRMTIMGVYGPRRMALKRAILWCYTLETLKAGLTTWRPYVGLSQLIWRGAFQPAQSSTSGNVGSVEPYTVEEPNRHTDMGLSVPIGPANISIALVVQLLDISKSHW